MANVQKLPGEFLPSNTATVEGRGPYVREASVYLHSAPQIVLRDDFIDLLPVAIETAQWPGNTHRRGHWRARMLGLEFEGRLFEAKLPVRPNGAAKHPHGLPYVQRSAFYPRYSRKGDSIPGVEFDLSLQRILLTGGTGGKLAVLSNRVRCFLRKACVYRGQVTFIRPDV